VKRLVVALLALGVASSGGTSHAKPPASSAADDARARKLFEQGDAAYAEGRYEDALAAFEEAHRLSPRPRLLFNIGNALERLGRLGDAADALEKYLAHAKPVERDVLEKRIQNLRKRAVPTTKIELEEEPEPKPAVRAEAKQPERKAPSKPPQADAPAAADTTLGWVLLGAGGAALGAGAIFGAMALSARKDVDAACKESAGQKLCDVSASDARDRDQRYSLLADVSLGVGVVAVGAGVYFLVTAPSGPRAAKRFGADVALSPSGGALRVHGEL